MNRITRWGARCAGTLSVLLLGGVAVAAPETDVSELDLTNARKTVTVTGIELEVLPSLGHGNGAAILAGPRFVQFVTESIFIGGGAFAGPLLNRPGQTGGFSLSWPAA